MKAKMRTIRDHHSEIYALAFCLGNDVEDIRTPFYLERFQCVSSFPRKSQHTWPALAKTLFPSQLGIFWKITVAYEVLLVEAIPDLLAIQQLMPFLAHTVELPEWVESERKEAGSLENQKKILA